jgi:hypothetical protein
MDLGAMQATAAELSGYAGKFRCSFGEEGLKAAVVLWILSLRPLWSPWFAVVAV